MRYGVAVLCVVLALAGCRRAEPAGPELTVKNYFPLEVGNRWVYNVNGMPIDTAVIRSCLVNSHDEIVYGYFGSWGVTFYMSNDDGMVVQRDSPDRATGRVLLCEPFEVGATWNQGDFTYRVDDTKAVVSVYAGKFEDCLKVSKWQGPIQNEVFYYAPGVGLVKDVIPALPESLELFECDIQ